MGIDRLVGSGSTLPPTRPLLRAHSTSLLRTRGRHPRRPVGNRSYACCTGARDGSLWSCPSASHREARRPRPSRHRAADGWRGRGSRRPSHDRGPSSGGAIKYGRRYGSGPFQGALHRGHRLRRGGYRDRSSGSRRDYWLGRRKRGRRSHHNPARGRFYIRNGAGQRVKVHLEVVQLLQVEHSRHGRRFHYRRRSGWHGHGRRLFHNFGGRFTISTEMRADFVGKVVIERTGVRLLIGNTQSRQVFQNNVAFYFQFTRQFVNPNLPHA